jgi:hypothetical protein
MPEDTLLEKYNSLYLEVIMRYKEYIEERETLHVAELPTLVTPDDEAVIASVKNIKAMFATYNYDTDFPEAAREAEWYVREKIITTSLPIQFWLKPRQTISLEAGDVFDKAVLLCSLLIGLGNVSSKIITAVSGSGRKLAVYCEFKDRIVFFEIEGKAAEFGTKEEMLSSMGIGKSTDVTAYEFNDKMYNNLA